MACRTGEACGLTETRSPRFEVLEVKRRHDAHHRRRRRLVPADLHARALAPHPVRMVDHADGQPEDAPLDLVQYLQMLFEYEEPLARRSVLALTAATITGRQATSQRIACVVASETQQSTACVKVLPI